MRLVLNDSIVNNTAWPCVLSVAGSDSGAGAGIQADSKTCSALGAYAVTAITAITAQNSYQVSQVQPLSAQLVEAQMMAVLTDFPVAAIKLGMLCDADIVSAVVDVLKRYPQVPVVLDPVIVSTSGSELLSNAAISLMLSELMPRVCVITPNIQEAACLLNCSTEQVLMAPEQALQGLKRGGDQAVLLKGGHRQGSQCEDLLLCDSGLEAFSAERVQTRNSHGTGCTLSTAIAVHLAKGCCLSESVGRAKQYITGALKAADQLGYGHGAGPLQHFFV